MTDEHHAMAEEGRAVAIALEPSDAGLPAPVQTEKEAGATPPPSPRPPEKTPDEAEKGVITRTEPNRTTKAHENMEFGAGISAFSASMMVAWYFLSPEARGAYNLRYIIPMLLAFACFTSGLCLMLLSMNILDLPEHIVADVQDIASKYLSSLCSTLPVVTLLSPLVLSGYKVYRYIGLTLLVTLTTPFAVLQWYTGFKAKGGDEEAAYKEHKDQLEAAFKLISAISNSASGGLVALVVNYNVTGDSGHAKGAVLVAIFCIFTTAIWGLLSMEFRTKVLEVSRPWLRGLIIQAMWLAIFFMLLSLACAVLAEAFAIVEFWIFAAFVPWVFASAIYLFLEHCVHRAAVPRSNSSNALVVQLSWKADKGIKLTMWSFTAIIGIFGGFLHGQDKVESLKACIILLTSAFMSGFALTLLSLKPFSTKSSIAAAIKVLDLIASATFAAAVFALIVAGILKIK